MRKHLKKLKHVRLHTKRRSVEAHTLHRRRKDTSLSFALCPHPTVNAFLFAVIFFAVAAALILGAKPKLFPQEGLTPVAITNSNGEKIVFYAEVADNDTERIRGLSDHEKIAENRGMFFVFENEAVAGFWMVKMKFPIDMIFFDRGMKIVDIVESAQPCAPEQKCPIYYSKVPVMYVLEINAGLSNKNSIHEGNSGEF
ncbi:TPA: DUF192 domain-containing protein [archaeon]|nr:DUF192 domain-containing protein [Candidatus Naiadarchaeales archaeon SRR2090159.bin1288]